MSFIKNKPVKVKYTRLPNNQINTIVKPKNNYHVFWWWKGLENMYIKYDVYYDGDQIHSSTMDVKENFNHMKVQIESNIGDGFYE